MLARQAGGGAQRRWSLASVSLASSVARARSKYCCSLHTLARWTPGQALNCLRPHCPAGGSHRAGSRQGPLLPVRGQAAGGVSLVHKRARALQAARSRCWVATILPALSCSAGMPPIKCDFALLAAHSHAVLLLLAPLPAARSWSLCRPQRATSWWATIPPPTATAR